MADFRRWSEALVGALAASVVGRMNNWVTQGRAPAADWTRMRDFLVGQLSRKPASITSTAGCVGNQVLGRMSG